MQYLKYLLVVGLLAFCFTAEAQYYEEVIYLKNGSIIRGDVLEQTGEQVKIEIEGGSILVYKMSEIKKIIKEQKGVDFQVKEKSYKIKDSGFYHAVVFGLLPGTGAEGSFAFGGSLHYTFGKQFKPILGAGVGVGVDSYIYDEIRTIIPIYAEARGYFMKKPFSPYYSLNAGYGFALINDTWNMTDAKGGIMLHPKIGFRFPSRSNATFITEFGFLYQEAEFTFDGWSGRYQDNVSFKRFSMSFGVLF